MPSNDIHPLPNTKEGFEAKLKAEPTWPKWTEFMAKQVEPAMGKLLDVPVFNPREARRGRLQLRQLPQARGRETLTTAVSGLRPALLRPRAPLARGRRRAGCRSGTRRCGCCGARPAGR